MVITRVNPMSVAKVAAMLYARMGLLCGVLLSLFAGLLFGTGALIVMPIVYGICGFIGTLIFAALFNVSAGITDGIEIETR